MSQKKGSPDKQESLIYFSDNILDYILLIYLRNFGVGVSTFPNNMEVAKASQGQIPQLFLIRYLLMND